MPRCKTPDTLIGIGGGGSRIVYRFMSQKWILEEVLKTDVYEMEEPSQLHATVIDSATDDTWHNQRAANASQTVSEAFRSMDYDSEDDRYLSFDGPKIIPNMVPDAWLAESLTAPPSVRRLCSDQNLRSWWMDENQEPLSTVNARGFGGGVQRRRSVSKALYHIADHVEESVAPRVDNDDEVAVVAALGGGTGSGMALDIAEDLDCQRAHLYAVIPHNGDQENEKTNAHAALSELEYLQLTGDNPFSTITILPYVEDLDDREFEMAVVRTILAHQNGVQGGNFEGNIFPDGSNGPPEFSAFTLAVPYTVQYDIEARTEAEDEIQSTLAAKRGELKREANLYEVVETYLKESFPDSAGAVLRGDATPVGRLDTEAGRDQALQLRQRIEDDLYETFLDNVAFEVAGFGDIIEAIRRHKKRLYDSEAIPNDLDDVGTMEEARQFIETAPETLQRPLDSNEFTFPEEETKNDLIEVIDLELENVARRRDLWLATSVITSEKTELEKTQADRIRESLREGILDDQVQELREQISDPAIPDEIERLQRKKIDLEDEQDNLQDTYHTIATDLHTNAGNWREDIWEEAEVLAKINKHRAAVEKAIGDLEEELDDKASEVDGLETKEGADDKTLGLEQIGPLNGMDLEGVKPLNNKLDDMDVKEIETEDLIIDYQYLTDSREAHIGHDPGLPGPFGTDREGDFEDALDNLADNGQFTVNPDRRDVDISQSFNATYSGNLSRSDQINERREEAIKNIVDAFEDEFIDDGGPVSYSRQFFDEELPVDLRARDLKTELKASLEQSDADSDEAIFNDVFPTDKIVPSKPEAEMPDTESAVIELLFESYLQPVGEEHASVVDELDKLVDEEDDDAGLIDRLERLQGLSNPETANVELPEANPRDRGGETYGRDFAREYDGIYEIELEREIETQTDDHPYLEHRTADPADLVGAPEDIDDSDVLDNHEENIVREFERSVNRMFGDDVRVPLKTLEPRGTAEHDDVSPEYHRLRFRPVYMSRAFDHEVDNIDQKYQSVRRELRNNRRSLQQNSLYKAESYDSGGPDEMTMVMFIGGVFLDNISLLTTLDGYKDQYEIRYGEYDFIGAHHSVGLGKMEKWETLSEWINDDADDQGLTGDVGGYVYRDRLRDVTDGEFIDDLMVAATGDDDPADILLEMYECEAYNSTLSDE